MKRSLDVHVRSVQSNLAIACDLCKATFSRQSNLTSHYKYVHDQLENIFLMEDGREIEYLNVKNVLSKPDTKNILDDMHQQYMEQKKTSNVKNVTTNVIEWII